MLLSLGAAYFMDTKLLYVRNHFSVPVWHWLLVCICYIHHMGACLNIVFLNPGTAALTALAIMHYP